MIPNNTQKELIGLTPDKQQQQKLIELIFDNISQSIFIINDQGEFIFICTDVDIFGYSDEEIKEMGNIKYILGENIYDTQQLSKLRQITNIEKVITDKSGFEHTILINIKQIAIGEGTVLITCRDLSDYQFITTSLIKRERHLQALIDLQNSLLTDNFDDNCYYETLKPIGEAANLSRIALLLVSQEQEQAIYAEQYGEWCAENIASTLKDPSINHFILQLFTPINNINQELKIIFLRKSKLADHERNIFKNLAMESVLAFPMKVKGILRGFMVFIDCESERIWEHPEVELLQLSATSLSLAIERKEALTERKITDQLFQETFEKAAVGMAHVGLDGHWLRVNQKLCDLVGYSSEELLKLTFQHITYPEDLEIDLDYVKQLLLGKIKQYILEKRYIKRDGELIWINLTATLVRDTLGNPNYFISVIEDITKRKKAEQYLLESEQKYRHLIENVQTGLVVHSTNTEIIYANDHAGELLGIVAEQMKGKTAFDSDWYCCYSDGSKMPVSEFPVNKVILEKTITRDYEMGVYNPSNQKIIWLLVNAYPEFNSQGEITTVVTNFMDISDRKNQENILRQLNQKLEQRVMERTQALQISENRFRTLIQTSGTLLVVLSSEYQILEWNQEAERVFGYSKDQVLGADFLILFAMPQKRQEIAFYIQQTLAGESFHNQEIMLQNKEGKKLYLLLNTTCWLDEASKPIGVIISGQDITVKKEIGQALSDSEERFRATFEQAAVGIFQLALNGHFLKVNLKFSQMLGYTGEQLLSMSLRDITHPDDQQEDYQQMQEIIHNQMSSFTHEKRYICQNGWVIWGQITMSLAFNNQGQPAYIIGIIEDISDRKKAEQQIEEALTKEKELNQLKTQFIDIASHEFRTPLTVILGSAEYLKSRYHKLDDIKKNKYLDNIQDAGQRINTLIEDVLTISRVESGKILLNPSHFDVISFCLQLIEEIQISTVNPIKFDGQGLELKIVNLDEKLLRHILYNLLSNALKYSPQGTAVDFKVQLDHDHNCISFMISDRGIGIPSEAQNHLFESFYRANNVGKIPGTGLGLNIVKQYVDLQGGIITCKSNADTGTTFTVTLPL
jgi:PAS domain S-box-containing protein